MHTFNIKQRVVTSAVTPVSGWLPCFGALFYAMATDQTCTIHALLSYDYSQRNSNPRKQVHLKSVDELSSMEEAFC